MQFVNSYLPSLIPTTCPSFPGTSLHHSCNSLGTEDTVLELLKVNAICQFVLTFTNSNNVSFVSRYFTSSFLQFTGDGGHGVGITEGKCNLSIRTYLH